MDSMTLKKPEGTVTGVIGEKNAVLVKVEVTITETQGGGSSTGHTVSRDEEWIVPAKVLTRGSFGVRDYFNYEVGDKVYILSGGMTADIEEWYEELETAGNFHAMTFYVAGAFYTREHQPPAQYNKTRMVDFGDGNYIEVDMEENSLDVHFTGAIYLNGKEIYLNG